MAENSFKQFSLDHTAKELLVLESEIRRRGDEQEGGAGFLLTELARVIGNLVCYVETPPSVTGESLSREWLESTKASINSAVGHAQNAVGMGDPLWKRLTTTRSLCLQLARLLYEVWGSDSATQAKPLLVTLSQLVESQMVSVAVKTIQNRKTFRALIPVHSGPGLANVYDFDQFREWFIEAFPNESIATREQAEDALLSRP